MTRTLSRRRFVVGTLACAAATGPVWAAPLPPMQVWKSPTCGCCKDWIAILQRDGFRVQTFDDGNNAARARFGLPARCGSCRTTRIAGYGAEGQVPAREIGRPLAEKPDAIGIAVPGMPIGSPGMDGPEHGGRRDPCGVLRVHRGCSSRVYASCKV